MGHRPSSMLVVLASLTFVLVKAGSSRILHLSVHDATCAHIDQGESNTVAGTCLPPVVVSATRHAVGRQPPMEATLSMPQDETRRSAVAATTRRSSLGAVIGGGARNTSEGDRAVAAGGYFTPRPTTAATIGGGSNN